MSRIELQEEKWDGAERGGQEFLERRDNSSRFVAGPNLNGDEASPGIELPQRHDVAHHNDLIPAISGQKLCIFHN